MDPSNGEQFVVSDFDYLAALSNVILAVGD
jgi:hypothetical protein